MVYSTIDLKYIFIPFIYTVEDTRGMKSVCVCVCVLFFYFFKRFAKLMHILTNVYIINLYLFFHLSSLFFFYFRKVSRRFKVEI